MGELKTILMVRDNLSDEEATKRIEEMKEKVAKGEDPEDILYDEGLEPDYVFDILE